MFHNHLGSLLAAGSVAAIVCATPAAAQVGDEQIYGLPAQDLATSLREVATRSGRNIIAPSELVAGRRAPAVSGPFTAEGVVRLLLTGSGLEVRRVGESLVVAQESAGSEARRPAEQGDATSATEETIVVTGTNIRGAQPTASLITITREEIDRTGATSVEGLMRTVPQNTQGGVNEESFGLPLPDQDPTEHGAGLNLRGLGQRATLVLVNGRRLAPSSSGSFVDVSLIPVSALERVEILPDGASAIYGSDAVGGVVNFILRDDFRGLETSIQAGTTTRGGGEQLLLSQAAGHDWTSGNAMLAYEYRLENEVEAGERPFTIGLRPRAHLLPRERRHSLLGTLEQELLPSLSLGLTGSLARRTTDRTVFQSISPLPISAEAEAESASLSAELSYELPGDWRLRLDGNYAVSDADQRQTQPGGIALVNSRRVRNAILEGGFRLDGSVVELPGGRVRIALGAQARREEYRDAFESTSIPEVVREADRNVRSVYGELLVPLFSQLNRRSGLERLQISAAARYDRYSGTGSTFDPRLGVLWSPLRGLNLRGSYSTSFRAPLLSEISGSYSVIYVPAVFFYADPSQAPAGSIAAVVQGSDPDVRPETSRNWSFGADWSPGFATGLTLSANYYDIRFSDRIALPTARANVIGNPAFAPIFDLNPDVAAVTRLIGGAQTVLDFSGPGFSNGGSTPADVDVVLDTRISNTAFTSTRGFDFGLRYAFSLGTSDFVLDANVNHIIEFDEQLTPASPIINSLDRPYRPLDWRARAGLGWSRGGWTGSLFLNHADDYQDDRSATLREVGAHTTFDASLAYTFGDQASWLRGTRISLYVENLFENDPPRLLPEQGSTTGAGYDPVNASGRGRFVALQVRRTW
ncbi:TonB-dependent receptor [Sphingosinicella rhizophila]|uniref:TonB-dependent receptor n=1 Tax=Sphingosinicella rhizophila TaxID=3050082 RepID=A0ABU3Q8Z3_9SPHN|nr:TonB-dependent receptor [Sphingosinicella sp. GR2756]MDT9599879.1 TonB-dependent receptor [Sphingosinicella sp. GR2756]